MSDRNDGPGGHGEVLGTGGRGLEQGGLRAGHPHLAAAGRQPIEQGGTAQRIEMGGDLVEQQHRPAADPFGNQIGMGEDDAEQ